MPDYHSQIEGDIILYLKKIAKNDVGGELEIQVLADIFQICITIFRPMSYISYGKKENPAIYLEQDEVGHYNVLVLKSLPQDSRMENLRENQSIGDTLSILDGPHKRTIVSSKLVDNYIWLLIKQLIEKPIDAWPTEVVMYQQMIHTMTLENLISVVLICIEKKFSQIPWYDLLSFIKETMVSYEAKMVWKRIERALCNWLIRVPTANFIVAREVISEFVSVGVIDECEKKWTYDCLNNELVTIEERIEVEGIKFERKRQFFKDKQHHDKKLTQAAWKLAAQRLTAEQLQQEKVHRSSEEKKVAGKSQISAAMQKYYYNVKRTRKVNNISIRPHKLNLSVAQNTHSTIHPNLKLYKFFACAKKNNGKFLSKTDCAELAKLYQENKENFFPNFNQIQRSSVTEQHRYCFRTPLRAIMPSLHTTVRKGPAGIRSFWIKFFS